MQFEWLQDADWKHGITEHPQFGTERYQVWIAPCVCEQMPILPLVDSLKFLRQFASHCRDMHDMH